MNKEKQIEEMANIINEMDEPNAHYYDETLQAHEAFADCFTIAKHLYEKDYRKQEWISVEDRLPETYGSVICYTGYESVMELVYNPKYKLFNVSYDNIENAIAVTHWMPLPEAPKI